MGYFKESEGVSVVIKQDRSLLKYILLSIITCGIYSWIFLYELAKDVNIPELFMMIHLTTAKAA